jgi:hypothetical protein
MATESNLNMRTFVAAENLDQFELVRLDNTGKAVTCAAADVERYVGVTTEAVVAGRGCAVNLRGSLAKVKASGTCTAGATVGIGGTAGQVADGGAAVGTCAIGGAAGAIVTVHLVSATAAA